MMKTTQCACWLVALAFVGAAGCSSAELDEPIEVDHQDETSAAEDAPTVTAWVPGTSVPVDVHVEGMEHSLEMDWVLEEESVAALTDHSSLIIAGQVESTRFDVIRTFAQSKEPGIPTGPESGVYTDLPVTIATVKVDEVARAWGELQTPDGEAVAAGRTLEVVFAGGLLSDGCTIEPEDNPLPQEGEQTLLFLNPHADANAPNGVAAPLATGSVAGLYAVTGGPMGRVLVEDGVVTGAVSEDHGIATQSYVGEPVSTLLDAIRAQAAIGDYKAPEPRPAPVMEDHAPAAEDEASHSTELGWCGVPTFGYKWCRNPAGVTYTDYSGWRWPVASAMNEWMYTSISNNLYLYRRTWGGSDVMVYENWYGYNSWYGYAFNNAWWGCMHSSIVNLNNSYYSGWHYAKTVSTHEIGHTLGLTHHWNCNSIMHSNPVSCRSSITYCDAQAASQLYPYR